ncbi:MAG: hypothetical protein ACRD20_10870 [Terriglobales bacterium]
MRNRLGALFLACALSLLASSRASAQNPADKKPAKNQDAATLWSEPDDIASRNLLYGAGGVAHQPHGTMVFVEEKLSGSNPKFYVRDPEGTKWVAKMGVEAKPETAATHLLWAVGYDTDEDYFVPRLTVEGLPSHLMRGQNLVGSDGMVENVRLERQPKKRKKTGNWKWRDNPFTGTREFNGLRVMMALLNSWDLKDENNAIYELEGDEASRIYVVSDLGATFGTTGYSWTQAMAKGNLKSYRHSRFIAKVGPEFVDFNVPTRPDLIYFFHVPRLIRRLRLRWIGRHIPRQDAKWIGDILAQLSPQQIQDAFRSAGYSPREVEGFAKVVEDRIAELTRL